MNSVVSAYSTRTSIKDALSSFFEKYQLGPDGGMNSAWAKLRFGKFYIPFPNTASRKKALIFHDIHHIVTGYESNWKGEAAIGAWEVSTGCGTYSAAWALDLWAFAMGLLFFPKAVFKAFIRGRRTHNLYHATFSEAQLLEMNIGEVQTALKLNAATGGPAKLSEALAFTGWALIAAIVSFIPFISPYLILIWWWLR